MNTGTFFGTAIAVLLVINQQVVESAPNTCDTPKCVEEAAKIIQYLDPDADPCEDFYQFACGNFLKNALGDEELELSRSLQRRDLQEVVSVYQEDVHEHDHKMVKVAKKLYRGCMDEWTVQRNFLRTVEDVFRKVGGWPVLEGSSWKEEHFDWLNATYELRRLGYDSSAFLSLQVQGDPDDRDKRTYVVDGGVRGPVDDDVQKGIAHMAVLFGADNEESAFKDLTPANEFLKEMNELHKIYPDHARLTIEEIQQKEGVINWLEFITNLAGPKVRITKDDHVRFPTKQYLKKVIELISKTPKRTQANYMMWKVIEPLLRFLPNCPAGPAICDPAEKRTELCVREARIRLITKVPDPVDVLRLRRYLSEEKKKKVEELVLKVVSEFVGSLSKAERIPEETKRKLLDTLKDVKVVVGTSDNYFEDKILDDSDVDVGDVEDGASFFALLAQVNRNLLTVTYARANTSTSENVYGYYMLHDLLPSYYSSSNLLYIPLSATKRPLYDEKRPEYLNYGALGTVVAFELSQMFQYEEAFSKVRDYLSSRVENDTINRPEKEMRITSAIETIIGEQISHRAYEEWVKNNREQQKLVATSYTPEQLFWISAAGLKCQPIGASKFKANDYDGLKIHSTVYGVSESFRHIPDFAEDFNCPANSKLNPPDRCEIF